MRVLFLTNALKGFTSRAVHGIMRLSSALKQKGHTTAVSELNEKQLRRDIASFSPDVIAYSVMSCNFPLASQLNARLKNELDFISVFGGPHATYFPEIVKIKGVDAVCRGEGEPAFVEFLDRIEMGNGYHNTENFWVKKNGSIHRNPVRVLVEDLDTLPLPDHELFCERFWDVKGNPMKSFHTSRGCPYKCAYCYVSSHKELYNGTKPVRFRSVGNVLEEIEQVKARYPLGFLKFYSDIFFLKKDWLEQFAEEYSSRIGIPFWCMLTPSMVDKDVTAFLKKAGCRSVGIGVEAGSETVRKEIFRRNITNDSIKNALTLLSDAGIRIETFNMLGIPGSSLADDLKLLELNESDKVTYSMATLLTPFPRTAVYEEAEKRGLLPEGGIDYHTNVFGATALNLPERKKIQRLQKLLALAVRFRFIRKLLPILLALPLDFAYRPLYKLWMSYSFRFEIFPCRAPLKLNLVLVKRFFLDLKLGGNSQTQYSVDQISETEKAG